MEDQLLGTIHHNGALRNGKAIALNSAKIKIVRTETKTPHEEFSQRIISYLIKLLSSTSDEELSATDGPSRIGSNRDFYEICKISQIS